MLNPTPAINGNSLWIPVTSDYNNNNSNTTITNTILTEINNLEIPNKGNFNVNTELYYHTRQIYRV